jgi:hypothetical protein
MYIYLKACMRFKYCCLDLTNRIYVSYTEIWCSTKFAVDVNVERFITKSFFSKKNCIKEKALFCQITCCLRLQTVKMETARPS